MEDTPTLDSVHIVCRLTVRPPIYTISSRDIFTCAPYLILVWVSEITGFHRSPLVTCRDQRQKNKGFSLVDGDSGDLVGGLIAGGRRRLATVAGGDLRAHQRLIGLAHFPMGFM